MLTVSRVVAVGSLEIRVGQLDIGSTHKIVGTHDTFACDLFNVVGAEDGRASSAGDKQNAHLGMGSWGRRVPGGLEARERPRSDVAWNVGKNMIGMMNALASSFMDSRNI